jgi:hypothetical protein
MVRVSCSFGFNVLWENACKGFGRIAAPNDRTFAGRLDRTTCPGTIDSGMNLTADYRAPLAGVGMVGTAEKIHKPHFEKFRESSAGAANGSHCLRAALGSDTVKFFSDLI